jgi:hypothetical protein
MQGFDNRCTNSSKRDHCKAMLRPHCSEDHGLYVSKHVAEHNHELSLSCGEKREWNSHSKIEQCVKDIIRYLRENMFLSAGCIASWAACLEAWKRYHSPRNHYVLFAQISQETTRTTMLKRH